MTSNAPAPLTYTSPQEVLISQPTTLTGTYNPQQITKVSLVAEDKYPLTVKLNATTRRWEVPLSSGFTQAGMRWLRLKGTNAQGKVVSEQIIYVTVSARPMASGQSFGVKIVQDTVFKAAPISSTLLNIQQKVTVRAGQTFRLNRYAQDGNHLKVDLLSPLSPVGHFGYFYGGHVKLEPATGGPVDSLPKMQMMIRQKTWIKQRVDDASLLISAEKAELEAGRVIDILGYAPVARQFRVTLAEPIPGFGKSGYVFNEDVEIQRDGVKVVYDPNAITITPIKTTLIKKRAIDSSQLPSVEKSTVLAGMIFGVSKYSWQDSHIQVWLTENIPNFGNTGFFFPDFVELKQGDRTIDNNAITYAGPQEVLVDKPTVLNGGFDPTRVTTISVIAEDKVPLRVALNSTAKTWQVNLDSGFNEPGARWLRVRATNSRGQVVDNQIINITVSSDPLTVGESLSLKTLIDTFFKAASVDSADLTDKQKTIVRAGQILPVKRYGYVDGHLKVELDQEIAPVGNFGYFYEPSVQLSKGSDVLFFDPGEVPGTDVSAKVLVVRTTQIKTKPIDSSDLPANQSQELIQGQALDITGYACVDGHFWLRLANPIPGFGNTGYVFWQHIRLIKNEQIIAYDPDALTMTALQSTPLKKRLADLDTLAEEEVVMLPGNSVYGLASYAIAEDHIKVSLTQEFPNFGNTGFVPLDFVRFARGGKIFDVLPSQVELNVPYFSQRDNPRFYWSTCNVTSIAMIFFYYGVRSRSGGQLEDELLQWCLSRYGAGSQTDHSVLTQLIRAYGFKSSFSTTRTWRDVELELVNGRPVVLAGDFTATGHIVTLIGYTPNTLIVNDPWGNALTGYKDTEGRKLYYPNAYVNRVCGPDGKIWAHFITQE